MVGGSFMIFSSTLFIFVFLPFTILLYYIVPKKFLMVKNLVLLLTSLVFYAWGEPVVIGVMLLSILVNYLCGLRLGSCQAKERKGRGTVVFTVLFNLGLLGFFKYANFAVDNINALSGMQIPSVNIMLPIGISFFTFQILSYTLDVYRRKTKPQKNLFSLALYISFFPQLIAGPIVRYVDIEEQLSKREHSVSKFAQGVQRFIVGFSKKILIANTMAVFADMAFQRSDLSAPMAWVGIVAYALQIYFDFSGYSDMAIGLGKMFGFTFLENFNYPYIAPSVQNFWRRWHISLSSWFRDYLYIPLGGNRKGNARTYLNLLVVFFATGLWHGASWSFVIWGLWHGLFMMIERAFLGKLLARLPKLIGWIYTMLVVLIGWVVFRAETLTAALQYLQAMFTVTDGGLQILLANIDLRVITAMLIGIIGSAPIVPWLRKVCFDGQLPMEARLSGFRQWTMATVSLTVCLGLFVFSVVFLTGSDFNPFLYFRF